MNKTNAGQIVKTPEEFEQYQDKLLSDNVFYESACNDCKTVFEAQQGALDFVISKLS